MNGSIEPPAHATLSDDYCRSVLRLPGTSKFVKSDDANIHYLEWGNADASLPVLLFVHGMLGHAHWWDIIAPFFAQQYRVLAVDLSGMGDSARRETYDGLIFTNDIAAVVERESRIPVTIVGHSFGGSRTVAACSERPELFRHAVLVDSPLWMVGEDLPSPRRLQGENVYPDKASAVARLRLLPEQPVCSPALRTHIAEWSLKEVSGGWTWKFDPLLWGTGPLLDPPAFDAVRTPMDFIRGERSGALPAERMQQITTNLKNLRRVLDVPAGYHHLMLDQPLALVSTLRALLADAP